jgi:hypothetical protein
LPGSQKPLRNTAELAFPMNREISMGLGLAQKLLGILSAKCPVSMGLLRTDYAKLFLYDPLILIKNIDTSIIRA